MSASVARADIEARLQELYAARSAGDLHRLCELFAADAVFEISGAAYAKPIAIRTRGTAGYQAWLSLLLKAFRVTELLLITMIIDGPKAAVRWRANIHSKITGAMVPTELIDLIEFRDGKIASYIEFFTRSATAPTG